MDKLKLLDAYAKTLDDFRVKTAAGALLSISSLITIFILVVFEYLDYQHIYIRSELVVDKSRRERLPINLMMTFHKIPCHLLNVDVMDVSGEQQNDITKSLAMTRIDRHQRPLGNLQTHSASVIKTADSCGKCYGASPPPSGCCNTCEEVREAYSRMGWAMKEYDHIDQCKDEGWNEKLDFDSGEGCVIEGKFMVNKVAGNFHFAPGKSFKHQQMHVHDVQSFAGRIHEFDFTHTINGLSFGNTIEGAHNPLDNYRKDAVSHSIFYQYFIKIVPSAVSYLNGTTLLTNQYSVTHYEKGQTDGPPSVMPGVFFNYDISPMKVVYTETKKPFSSFITGICAIFGGIFTFAGLFDTFIYSAERAIKRKIELGKIN